MTEGASDELYGVAPAAYYIKNLFVNLNVVFPLALLLPVLAVVGALCTTGHTGQEDRRIYRSEPRAVVMTGQGCGVVPP